MNIILCFETRFSAFVVFFQILFMVSVFLNSWYKNELQNGYMFVKFTGYKINKDEKVSIIYDELLNQFYSMEEYKEKYRVL